VVRPPFHPLSHSLRPTSHHTPLPHPFTHPDTQPIHRPQGHVSGVSGESAVGQMRFPQCIVFWTTPPPPPRHAFNLHRTLRNCGCPPVSVLRRAIIVEDIVIYFPYWALLYAAILAQAAISKFALEAAACPHRDHTVLIVELHVHSCVRTANRQRSRNDVQGHVIRLATDHFAGILDVDLGRLYVHPTHRVPHVAPPLSGDCHNPRDSLLSCPPCIKLPPPSPFV
jgi:hypothetical protein